MCFKIRSPKSEINQGVYLAHSRKLAYYRRGGHAAQGCSGSARGRFVYGYPLLDKKGIDKDYLLSKCLISPATCCLVNPDGEKTVEKAFRVVSRVSQTLREKFGLA